MRSLALLTKIRPPRQTPRWCYERFYALIVSSPKEGSVQTQDSMTVLRMCQVDTIFCLQLHGRFPRESRRKATPMSSGDVPSGKNISVEETSCEHDSC
ncbi:hypothetical protein KIN20_030843 [Parelaphostrongylus tenuis]|uniref:Uncharacterized protein n=1 Tax=Parelaphostrongylus tenuis TaxID=148309 RepID=A0AAD5R4R4_PARTN|nr:hypothetical protein KIN20_030843 [Parelaphostrongylus tenuis]